MLLKMFIKHPLYTYPTHKATLQALRISEKSFPRKHHKHGKENAFRHALWNVLIAKKCYKPQRSIEDLVSWAEKITSLHEELAPNEDLEKAMDLHNNQMGRQLFISENLHEKDLTEIQEILIQVMEKAVKVESLAEIDKYKYNLVYIEDV